MAKDWTVSDAKIKRISGAYSWYTDCGDCHESAIEKALRYAGERCWRIRAFIAWKPNYKHAPHVIEAYEAFRDRINQEFGPWP